MEVRNAGWSSLVARRAHNPKVVGSNPAPATKGFVPKLVKLSTEVPVRRSKLDLGRDFCFPRDFRGDRDFAHYEECHPEGWLRGF